MTPQSAQLLKKDPPLDNVIHNVDEYIRAGNTGAALSWIRMGIGYIAGQIGQHVPGFEEGGVEQKVAFLRNKNRLPNGFQELYQRQLELEQNGCDIASVRE